MPLWITLLGNITKFKESRANLMGTLEKIIESNVMKPYAGMVAGFIYNLIYLEERLGGGDKSSKELQEILFRCYEFIRKTYFDFELKNENKDYEPLMILAKALCSEDLCKVLKSLCIEIITMVKIRLGSLIHSEENTNILSMFVYLRVKY